MSEIRERKFGDFTFRILREECIGTGACTKVVPEVLAYDAQQIIDFLEDPRDDVEPERLYEACEVCPVDALRLLDADGEEVSGPLS